MECTETEDCLVRPSQVLPAKLRRSNGATSEVEVLDVSLAGCLIERRGLPLAVGDRVLIRLSDLAFMPATVVWIEALDAGLMFETELYEPVLEVLKRSFSQRR